MEPVITPPDGGRRISYGGQELRVLHEAGDLAVAEFIVPAAFGGPFPHVHHGMDEGFLVVDGTLTMLVGQDTVQVAAGSFVMATRGTRHTFSNPGDQPVHLICTWTPASGLALIDDIGGLVSASGVRDPAAIAEVYRKHNSELA
jgi:mannose-6-phosphate isomerase-like protein (cupin superfamily)